MISPTKYISLHEDLFHGLNPKTSLILAASLKKLDAIAIDWRWHTSQVLKYLVACGWDFDPIRVYTEVQKWCYANVERVDEQKMFLLLRSHVFNAMLRSLDLRT